LIARVSLTGLAPQAASSKTALNVKLNAKRPDQGSVCVSANLSQVRTTFGKSEYRDMHATMIVPSSCVVAGTLLTLDSDSSLALNENAGLSWLLMSTY
jgi:hypothetical protein